MPQATEEQISDIKHAKGYLDEAVTCRHANPPLWRLGVVALGSALESLLRVKYGNSPGTLFNLIDAFDADPYWDGMQLHLGATRKCSTCSIDAIRKQRNSVHPHRWSECTQKEFDDAMTAVLLMQHILVYCQSRIADFPDGVAFVDIFREATEEEILEIGEARERPESGR